MLGIAVETWPGVLYSGATARPTLRLRASYANPPLCCCSTSRTCSMNDASRSSRMRRTTKPGSPLAPLNASSAARGGRAVRRVWPRAVIVNQRTRGAPHRYMYQVHPSCLTHACTHPPCPACLAPPARAACARAAPPGWRPCGPGPESRGRPGEGQGKSALPRRATAPVLHLSVQCGAAAI